MKGIFPGVWRKGRKIYTKNIVPGKSVYGEFRIKENGVEYREWDPTRSKPAAAILKGLKNFPIKEGYTILYLGIANGTTSSHFCDIIGEKGIIIGIDIAPKMFEKLIEVAGKRKSIVPVLADANKPQLYEEYIEEPVDILYMDVSQKNQAEIFLKNTEYVKKGGYCIIALKAKSIDIVRPVKEIYEEALKEIKTKLKVIETKEISPYEMDHLFIVCRKE